MKVNKILDTVAENIRIKSAHVSHTIRFIFHVLASGYFSRIKYELYSCRKVYVIDAGF